MSESNDHNFRDLLEQLTIHLAISDGFVRINAHEGMVDWIACEQRLYLDPDHKAARYLNDDWRCRLNLIRQFLQLASRDQQIIEQLAGFGTLEATVRHGDIRNWHVDKKFR